MNTFIWEYAFRDLFKNKTRTILGIVGISISIFLLSTVLFLTDSLSNSFVDYMTTDSGGQDLNLSVRHYTNETVNRSSYFEYQQIVNQIEQNVSAIKDYFPRSSFYCFTNGSPIAQLNITRWCNLMALDFKKEEAAGFGKLNGIDSSLTIDSTHSLPANSCIISPIIAQEFNIKNGDQLKIFVAQLNAWINLTVLSTFTHSLKFPSDIFSEGPERYILVDWALWGDTANKIDIISTGFDWNGKCNQLVMILKNAGTIYDIRDIDGTEEKVMKIGENILLTVGVNAYRLDYPKLNNLGYSSFLNAGTQVIFLFIGVIAMLIAGILINGILTTSVEERIKEYGVNRVLGARKIYNVKLIIIQGVLLATFGTSLGILESTLVSQYVIMPLVNGLLPEGLITNGIQFVPQISSYIISYAIGIGVSLVVSISPALKVMQMKIIESINPYRHEESIYKLERDATTNSKLIIFGAVLAANGLFVYALIPQVILSMDVGLIASMLFGTLLVFLIGISLLALGLMPLFLKIFVTLLNPIYRKIMNIVSITIYRYQRRNMSTVIMFIISFSFIMFTTSIVQIQEAQIGGLIQYNNGSDISVRPTVYDLNGITVDFQQDLMTLEEIERTSVLLASTIDLTRIYADEGKEFSVSMGDYINFKSNDIRLYGIDRNYKDVVYDQQFLTFTEGNRDTAFAKVFYENATNVIISEALSNAIDLHVGDLTRFTFTRGDEQETVIGTVVGVSGSMPGLTRFKSGQFQADNGGVIMSQENYVKYLNIPGGANTYVDQIFIKVKTGVNHNQLSEKIENLTSNKNDIDITVTSQVIAQSSNVFTVVKYVFLLILGGTVLIGLFGLISAAYSSVLERKREIGIIRTLGLHGKDVRKMFLIENVILLLSAGGSGGVIGYILARLLADNMTMFTESPSIIAVPWDIIIIIVVLSLATLYLGMRKMLRQVERQNLIEIYRATQ